MQGPKETHNHDRATAASPGGSGGQVSYPQNPSLSRLLHDLNQPLSAINNYAQAGAHLIDNALAEPARMKDLFDKIVAQCARATALSQEISKALARDSQQS